MTLDCAVRRVNASVSLSPFVSLLALAALLAMTCVLLLALVAMIFLIRLPALRRRLLDASSVTLASWRSVSLPIHRPNLTLLSISRV
ncbi:hypothetical protein [Cryobacterium sp. Y11]|uniref:hypothetical protein n=1 Tax=Cryobacterium sp. Y11 TaxID=2045016 RepID=UPI000CE53110|nr:hypothetical protein [Cryobacterium sp. Y11]